jgi:hypothetical protein
MRKKKENPEYRGSVILPEGAANVVQSPFGVPPSSMLQGAGSTELHSEKELPHDERNHGEALYQIIL